MALLITYSWSVLPMFHVGRAPHRCRGTVTSLTVGWLCIQVRIRLG